MNSFEWKYKNIINKRRNKKIAAKTESKAEQDKAVKLQTYDLSLFIGQSYFVNDEVQLYLILQPLHYTLKKTRWYWKNFIMEI